MTRESSSQAFMIQAKELFDAGKFSAAIMTLQEGLKQYPHFISARVLLGEIYWTSGEVVLAKTELERVIKAVPDNYAAHRKLAMIYRETGEIDAAVRSCRTVLQANPRDLEMRALLDQLQLHAPQSKSLEKGGATQQAAGVELSADSFTGQESASSATITPAGEPAESASSEVVDAATIDTETLAELYIIQGHRERGLSVYRRLMAKDPTNARYHERIEALEGPLTSESAQTQDAEPSPSMLAKDAPVHTQRRNQMRRLEGWLQVIRIRRRS